MFSVADVLKDLDPLVDENVMCQLQKHLTLQSLAYRMGFHREFFASLPSVFPEEIKKDNSIPR